VKQAEYIERELATIPGLRLQRTPVDRTRNIRRVMVQWDEAARGLTTADVDRQLMDGEPRIAVGRVPEQGIELTVFMNEPGEEKIAVQRIRDVFRSARS
jgi:hypothetical protein